MPGFLLSSFIKVQLVFDAFLLFSSYLTAPEKNIYRENKPFVIPLCLDVTKSPAKEVNEEA